MSRANRIARLAERVEGAVVARFSIGAGLPRRDATLPSNSDVAKAIDQEIDKLKLPEGDRSAVLREIEARYARAS
jgi:hypothetical protein